MDDFVDTQAAVVGRLAPSALTRNESLEHDTATTVTVRTYSPPWARVPSRALLSPPSPWRWPLGGEGRPQRRNDLDHRSVSPDGPPWGTVLGPDHSPPRGCRRRRDSSRSEAETYRLRSLTDDGGAPRPVYLRIQLKSTGALVAERKRARRSARVDLTKALRRRKLFGNKVRLTVIASGGFRTGTRELVFTGVWLPSRPVDRRRTASRC